MDRPAWYPTVLPWASFLTMYGPVATTCVLYVEGFFASNLRAYSSGTGIVIAIARAAATDTASGRESLNTIVWSSGVVMPEMAFAPFVGASGVPAIELKYEPYWPPTFAEKKRSKAYLTSFEVTSRLTGGLNFTPGFILTVTVLRSFESCGLSTARSGVGSVCPGLKLYSGRWVTYATM